jgi:hypothetical protein
MQAKLLVAVLNALIITASMSILFPLDRKTVTPSPTSSTGLSEGPFQGVNMEGYYTTMVMVRNYDGQLPSNYYEDSFRIFSKAGLSMIRYLFTWEAYEKNPRLFIDELLNVSKTADKWGLKIIYANDQFHVSSWLDPKSGYGFPSFLLENRPEFPFGGGGSSDSPVARSWWTNWYNKKITDTGGRDGWTLQTDFLKNLVTAVDKHPSTLGYEILNEPQVYSEDQWTKIGSYNTFVSNELRELTKKTIIFDRQLPSDIGGVIDALPENMAKMAPRNITNIVFKGTLYGLPSHCSYAEARLSTAARAAQLMKVPLWLGEFNIGITPEIPIADLNQTELNLFITKFREVDAWGWSLWLWSFRQHSQDVKNYDLAISTRDNKSGTEIIQPTKYFGYLEKNPILNAPDEGNIEVKKDLKGITAISNRHDTICPTTAVTRIEGTLKKTNYFLPTSPLHPLQLSVRSIPDKVLVQGETYDVGSGMRSVQIRLGRSTQEYQPVPLSTSSGSSDWSASIDINDIGIDKLIIKAVDKAGNVGYNTIFLNITRNIGFHKLK